ncbi:hypothetical protein JH06_5034 [Blastocystis sp. subtype 4]|uniref:hypothetical protein n=1 Tax=Blastocystis sp. subtype 4 TaxID=944170 RepID=UPI000712104A|nr:hypothetical protein JH06_5034 [Blastocystis sp. subtype 4]KNB41823.1 hypothetical protein JH06_5034 [Blastocystis sp. subtype 4]|eukprot:XP_014525266.1 hypothetical protein JH06_5034 [Blastocystis sp. subtype 4]
MLLRGLLKYSYGAINYGFTWSNEFLHGDSTFAIGKCFGLLTVNCLVPSSYVSMKNPKKISPIISLSIIFALGLYVAMGLLGLLTFNKVEKIDVFIMLNIPPDSPFFYTSSAVLCAMLVLITPIIVYPSSLTIDAWFTQGCKGTPKDALLENEVLPTVEENTNNSAPVTVSGAEGGVAVENPVEASVAPVEAPVVDVASATSDSAPKSTGPEPKERTGILITDLPGVAARVLPLLVMTVIGYVWPNFGNVVSITGASATSLVNFIFPTLLHLKEFGKQRRGLAVLDVVLTGFGIFAAVLGTYMSFF